MFITDDFGNRVYVSPVEPKNLQDLSARVLRIEDKLVAGAERMARTEAATEQIRADLEENTKMTEKVLSGLGDVVEFFTAMKGAFKVLNWIGAVAKPVAAIVGLVTAAAVAWKAWGGTS